MDSHTIVSTARQYPLKWEGDSASAPEGKPRIKEAGVRLVLAVLQSLAVCVPAEAPDQGII